MLKNLKIFRINMDMLIEQLAHLFIFMVLFDELFDAADW